MPLPRHRRPEPAPPPEPQLHFCANCQVSVAAIELDRGLARRTPRGRVFCALCVQATNAERTARRRALETEFADDAPIPSPVRRARRDAAAPRAPAPVAGRSLEERVRILEQAVLRLQQQLTDRDGRPS